MAITSSTIATLVSVLVVPLALVIFASGFFPYKPFLPGLSAFNAESKNSRPPVMFDRVIFMVVDSLRR